MDELDRSFFRMLTRRTDLSVGDRVVYRGEPGTVSLLDEYYGVGVDLDNGRNILVSASELEWNNA